jgi:hypothetical protein
MTFTEVVSKSGNAFKKHAPEILTCVSVVGVAGTAYLTGRAGYKSGLVVMADASVRMDAAPDGEDVQFMSAKEAFKQTWKFYIPAVSIGIITAVAIVGGNRISAQRNMALISAAAIGERAFQEYRERIAETTSKPKEQKVRDDIAQGTVVQKKDEYDKLVMHLGEGDVLCLETHSGRTFISTAEKIHRAENDANRDCLHDGYISANVFFEKLGLPYTDAGEVVGWNNTNNRLEVKIGGAVHDENKPVLTVGYYQPPSVTYANPF